jgi:hypothetical protein
VDAGRRRGRVLRARGRGHSRGEHRSGEQHDGPGPSHARITLDLIRLRGR